MSIVIPDPASYTVNTGRLVGNSHMKWSWACRSLDNSDYKLDTSSAIDPRVGDVALVRVQEVGHHKSIVTADNKKSRVYVGDLVAGVFGNRYATDAFEGEVDGLQHLSLLTSSGMVGTVKSRHRETGGPTKVLFDSFLTNERGHRINLKELRFHRSIPTRPTKNLIIVVGTGMNTGKTTTSRMLIRGLSEKGFKVAACKLTGSISNRDLDEMRSASARHTVDFSDYGFPSTYLCAREELVDLFNTMLADLEKVGPDIVVMEIADGILQRETALLLADPSVRKMTRGVLITAESAPSALYAVQSIRELEYKVLAVSGLVSSSPLSVRELKGRISVQVASPFDSGHELSKIVEEFVEKNVNEPALWSTSNMR